MTLPPALPNLLSHLPDIRPSSWSGWATNDTKNGELFRGELWIRHPYGSGLHLFADAAWSTPIDLSGAGFSIDFTYRIVPPFLNVTLLILGSSGGSDYILFNMSPTALTLYNGSELFHFSSWRPLGVGHVVLHFGEFLTYLDINDVTYLRTTGLSTFDHFSAQVVGLNWTDLDQDIRFDEVSLYRDIRESPSSPAPAQRISFFSDIFSASGTLNVTNAGTGAWTGDIFLGVIDYQGGTVLWQLDWDPSFGEPAPSLVAQGGSIVEITFADLGGGSTSRGELTISATIDGLHTNFDVLTSNGTSFTWGPAT